MYYHHHAILIHILFEHNSNERYMYERCYYYCKLVGICMYDAGRIHNIMTIFGYIPFVSNRYSPFSLSLIIMPYTLTRTSSTFSHTGKTQNWRVFLFNFSSTYYIVEHMNAYLHSSEEQARTEGTKMF